jgi:hypothetical protein
VPVSRIILQYPGAHDGQVFLSTSRTPVRGYSGGGKRKSAGSEKLLSFSGYVIMVRALPREVCDTRNTRASIAIHRFKSRLPIHEERETVYGPSAGQHRRISGLPFPGDVNTVYAGQRVWVVRAKYPLTHLLLVQLFGFLPSPLILKHRNRVVHTS